MTEEQLLTMPQATLGLCSKGCGRTFTHGPAKVQHERVCKGGTNTKKETNGEMAEGAEEARELSAANYGRDEWWVLLDPVDE